MKQCLIILLLLLCGCQTTNYSYPEYLGKVTSVGHFDDDSISYINTYRYVTAIKGLYTNTEPAEVWRMPCYYDIKIVTPTREYRFESFYIERK